MLSPALSSAHLLSRVHQQDTEPSVLFGEHQVLRLKRSIAKHAWTSTDMAEWRRLDRDMHVFLDSEPCLKTGVQTNIFMSILRELSVSGSATSAVRHMFSPRVRNMVGVYGENRRSLWDDIGVKAGFLDAWSDIVKCFPHDDVVVYWVRLFAKPSTHEECVLCADVLDRMYQVSPKLFADALYEWNCAGLAKVLCEKYPHRYYWHPFGVKEHFVLSLHPYSKGFLDALVEKGVDIHVRNSSAQSFWDHIQNPDEYDTTHTPVQLDKFLQVSPCAQSKDPEQTEHVKKVAMALRTAVVLSGKDLHIPVPGCPLEMGLSIETGMHKEDVRGYAQHMCDSMHKVVCESEAEASTIAYVKDVLRSYADEKIFSERVFSDLNASLNLRWDIFKGKGHFAGVSYHVKPDGNAYLVVANRGMGSNDTHGLKVFRVTDIEVFKTRTLPYLLKANGLFDILCTPASFGLLWEPEKDFSGSMKRKAQTSGTCGVSSLKTTLLYWMREFNTRPDGSLTLGEEGLMRLYYRITDAAMSGYMKKFLCTDWPLGFDDRYGSLEKVKRSVVSVVRSKEASKGLFRNSASRKTKTLEIFLDHAIDAYIKTADTSFMVPRTKAPSLEHKPSLERTLPDLSAHPVFGDVQIEPMLRACEGLDAGYAHRLLSYVRFVYASVCSGRAQEAYRRILQTAAKKDPLLFVRMCEAVKAFVSHYGAPLRVSEPDYTEEDIAKLFNVLRMLK